MNSLDRQYQELLNYLLNFSNKKQTRNGEVLSTFGWQIRHNMKDGFPLLTTKRMAWKSIVTELMWFLRGDTNIKYLVDNNCHIWDGDAYKNFLMNEIPHDRLETKEEFINKIKTDDKFAREWGNLGPIYGAQWRMWPTEWAPIDQIQNLINELKTNPDSRRLMVNAWNVGELDQMVLPPCHYGFQVYTRELTLEEKIEWVMKNRNIELENVAITEEAFSDRTPKRAISLMWNQRSVDTFLGLPFNIASYGLLLCILAEIVDMVPDQLIGNLGDVHLYMNHIDQARKQLTKEPYSLPKLWINSEFWPTQSGECGIGPLTNNINSLIEEMQIEDFQIENYQSHSTIKAPLSN